MNLSTSSRSRTARALTGAAAVVLLATGCSTTPLADSDPPTTSAAIPTPPGASSQEQPSETVDTDSCDPTTSLAPGTLPTPEKMPAGSPMEAIAKRGRLIVGTDIGSSPMSFRDPVSGDIEGFDVDVANWISEAIFGEPRIEFRILTTDERVSALKDGDVDVVVKSMSITCDRKHDVDFSAPYLIAGQRALTYRNSGITSVEGLSGKTICATRRATSIARIQDRVPNTKLVTAGNWADCQVMMQQGQVDAIVGDEPILVGLTEQDPLVHIVGDSIGTEYYGVGIPQGQDQMVRFVNGVLDKRRADGSWQASQQRWLLQVSTYPPAINYRD